MDTTKKQDAQAAQETSSITVSSAPEKQPWQEPKLTFVEPKLTAHGELKKVTGADGGFFGTFNP